MLHSLTEDLSYYRSVPRLMMLTVFLSSSIALVGAMVSVIAMHQCRALGNYRVDLFRMSCGGRYDVCMVFERFTWRLTRHCMRRRYIELQSFNVLDVGPRATRMPAQHTTKREWGCDVRPAESNSVGDEVIYASNTKIQEFDSQTMVNGDWWTWRIPQIGTVSVCVAG